MGLRFRKSVKIAPGVKLNLGAKSAGISVGGKYGGMSFNTKSGVHARASAPGTGLSYTTKVGGKSTKRKTSSSSAQNGGCLITCLKGLGILLLFSFFLAFGWIAGIVWLIFFRKKMNEDPAKQRKYTIGVSIASCVSFLFFIYSVIFAPPSPTSLILTSTVEGQELDINNDYIITVQYEPEDASLSSVNYTIDNALLATVTPDSDNPSSLTLHTNREGTINITARQGDVESNVLTFEILDKERIEKEKAEAEQKRLEEERAAKEAEEKRIAEEKAATEAEEQQLIEEASTQNQTTETTQTALTEVTADNPPASDTPTQDVPTDATNTQNGTLVWIDDTAKRYHKQDGCGMNNAYQVTLEEAEAKGKTPCGRCY